MKKHDVIIGIDGDVDKNGVATLHPKTRKIELLSLAFPQLLDYLLHMKETCENENESLIILVEAGWLNKSHWHVRQGDNKRIASAKGNSTGRNHEVGRKIIEMCKHYDLEVIEQRPLKKSWQGRDGKITHEEFAYFTGLMAKRSNQEERDAGLIAWNFAGLPIRVKVGINKKK